MYRRLDIISIQLEWLGSTHIKNKQMMLRRLARTEDINALENVVDYIEPVKGYKRNDANNFTKYSPYSLLVDVAAPDPSALRKFNKLLDALKTNPSDTLLAKLYQQFHLWDSNHASIQKMADKNPLLKDLLTHSTSLQLISNRSIELLNLKKKGLAASPEQIKQYADLIKKSLVPAGYCDLSIGLNLEKFILEYCQK
jgi:hexosaminidase